MLDKHAFAEAGSDVNAALHEVAAEIGAIELAEAAFALLPAVSL
jgi:predicted metal-dependent enzyme (double-stranded beta helix superfamily)